MVIRCIVVELMHYLILLNLLLSTDTWTVSFVFYNNYMKSYIRTYIYSAIYIYIYVYALYIYTYINTRIKYIYYTHTCIYSMCVMYIIIVI